MLTCSMCGLEGPDVQCVWDPYALDVNDEKIEINLCDACYRERIWDI